MNNFLWGEANGTKNWNATNGPEPTYTERVEKFKCRVVDRQDNMIFIDYPINTATKKIAFLIDGAQFRATFSTEKRKLLL